MGVAMLILSIAIVMILIMRGVPIFFTAMLSSIFLLLTSGQNVLEGMTTTYVQGLSGYFGQMFWLFALGAIFGNLFGVTGAADSIANTIINKLGEKAIIPACIVVGFVLSIGGVSVFVAFFAMYPLMVSMFRKADISRTLIPGVYFAGAGTASGMWPGSPSLQNTVACDMLGVGYASCLIPGWIAGIFEMVLVFAYTMWAVKHAKDKGLHFEEIPGEEHVEGEQKDAPGFVLSLIPMIVLIVVLNFTPIGAAASLFVGIVCALICFFKYYDIKDIWKHLSAGLSGGVNSLFNTSSIVGFGTVVAAMPAFQSIIAWLQTLGGNPLIISILAVAVLAGVSGSGTGGEGIALPIIKEYFVPMGVNTEALARCTALACLTLDSLPQNGLVCSVLSYTKNSHKDAYIHVFFNTVLIPIISLVVLVVLCGVFGYM